VCNVGFLWYAVAGVITTGQLTYWTGPLFDVAKKCFGNRISMRRIEMWGSRSELWSNLPRERGPRRPRRTWDNNVRSCTVHVDSIKFFICPTNAHKLL